jgi:hypothetical protein
MAEASTNERVTRLETTVTSMASDIGHIKSVVDTMGRTNWPLIISGGGLVVGLLGGLFLTSSLQQENMALKSKLEVMSYIQPVVVSAENSRSDRAALHAKVDDNTQKIAELRGKVDTNFSAFTSSIAEAEAQFRNVGNISNLRHQSMETLISLLWEKEFGTKLPQSNWFPQQHRDVWPEH